MNPAVSIVIPVLNDGPAAAELVRQIAGTPGAEERVQVTAVDAGSDIALRALGSQTTSIVQSQPGRARQMNLGAATATGEWLLFLHADSRLPPHWLDAIDALPAPVVGGWFRFALDDEAWQARVIEWGTEWRVRVLGLAYGDQGLLVRQATFRELGGFADVPLLEDVDFVRRLRRAGVVIQLPLPLLTSSRRWRRDGWMARSVRNLIIVTLYLAGVAPRRLARWYEAAPRARG